MTALRQHRQHVVFISGSEFGSEPKRQRASASLSGDVFERRTLTGGGLFALLSNDFEQIFGQIVSIRVKTLSHTNSVALRHIKREKGQLPVAVRPSKTSILKLTLAYSNHHCQKFADTRRVSTTKKNLIESY